MAEWFKLKSGLYLSYETIDCDEYHVGSEKSFPDDCIAPVEENSWPINTMWKEMCVCEKQTVQ